MWYPVQDDATALLTSPGDSPGLDVRTASPPTPSELDDWEQHFYTLSETGAAKLGFTVGEVSASGSIKVVVAETSRSKTITADDGKTQMRYGVALRLVIRATSFEGSTEFNLPMIAAEAQLGRIETQSHLIVRGYVGAKLAKLIPEWREFDVEGYVALKRSITEIQQLITQDIENIRPRLLHVFDKTDDLLNDDQDRERAIGIVWALTRILDGSSADDALKSFPLGSSAHGISGLKETYLELTGSEVGGKVPTNQAREKAQGHLGRRLRLNQNWL